MAEKSKDVMIYRYDPSKRYFLVSLRLENKPGALGNLADLLGVRGMNILEGFFGDITQSAKGVVSFFLETTNKKMDEEWLKDLLVSSVYVSDVEVKTSSEGFVADSINFPVAWNNGERALVLRIDGVRAMLDAVRAADPEKGTDTIYSSAYNFGLNSFEALTSLYNPRTKEGLNDLLQVYNAAGWGKIELLDVDFKRSRARVRLKEGFESLGLSTGKAECHFVRGHVAGAFSAIFGARVTASETRCTSAGAEFCEFEVSPTEA